MSLSVSRDAIGPHRQETARWAASLAAVVLVHAGIGWLMLRQLPMPLLDPAPPAVILDLAASEPAAEAEPMPEPPAPTEPALAAPTPPEPPPPNPVIEDAVPLPEPPKPVPPPKPPAVKPPPKPRPVVQRAAPTPTEAPSTEAATTAATTTATASASRATAVVTTSWQGRLQAHLARFKQYPADARMSHQEGTPVVRFTMTRSGKVLNYRLENSSGHDSLDREALALIERAQPLPQLPDEIPNVTIELVLPLRFQLH
jgi:protein TonB